MSLFKIVVTVPIERADAVREAIGKAGGGSIGNYAFCSFSCRGVGRFHPLDGANPAIGVVGRLEQVEEERVEVSCEAGEVERVVAAIRAAHPYEEPVIDIYPLGAEVERVAAIEERNARVEIDKAWETSWTRRILLVLFTYLAVGFYLSAISVTRPWTNAIVPAVGFMLSTLTLPFFKRVWVRRR